MNTVREGMETMQRINIIGCGQAGRPISHLLNAKNVFEIGEVACHSKESASQAVNFIRAGIPVKNMKEMGQADLFMLGVPDDCIAICAHGLARSGLLEQGTIVFHLSGSLPASELNPVKKCGALTASIHPIKSFADTQTSVQTFAGTFCGIEGDPDAVRVLTRAFEKIGGKLVPLDTKNKDIYHAASVFVCNYQNALLEIGLRCYMKAGLDRETARDIMAPLVRNTVENILASDTIKALTGPIARGDHKVVAREIDALAQWDPQMSGLYTQLGKIVLELSAQQPNASQAHLAILKDILGG